MPDQIVTITDKAKARVLEVRAGEPEGDALALWLEVTGTAGGEYAYDLYFDLPTEAGDGDTVEQHGELTVIIPFDSTDLLRGSTLDMTRDLLNPGLVLTNPNKPPVQTPASAAAMGELELSGTVAERVQQVLTQAVNPSIAAHGGRAELVAVEDDAALIRMEGGCQGCASAAATLSQGIDAAIRHYVPEITRVVDVTDHASGENPYFEHAHSLAGGPTARCAPRRRPSRRTRSPAPARRR